MTPQTPKTLAFSYVRMSTDKQLHGDSLRRQTELSSRYAKEHGLQLVEDFELHDRGVSAFKGENAATGALSRFLESVHSGKIPSGSYLLVESLDRLSREKVSSAMQLFLNITERGVNIVTLSDGQVYRAGQTEFPQLIYSMVVMSRANEESLIKSQRVRAAWENKRDHVSSKKLTKMAPKWLSLSEDRASFRIIDDRADTVRQIYRWAGEGHGVFSITQMLNRNGVAAFGRSNGWNESYVEKILKNRSVLGEYQPHSLVDGKRRPIGDPIVDYYPRIVSDDEFLSVQADRRRRATHGGGRRGSELKNLFTHVATCAYCSSPMRMVDKGAGPKGGRYLKCSAGVRGMGCTSKSWRYEDFERSFLFLAREVNLDSILNAEAAGKSAADLAQRVAAAVEKTTRLEIQRERMAELTGDPAVSLDYIRGKLASVQSELESTKALLEQLHLERESVSRPPADAADVRRLIGELNQLSGSEAYEHRSRLANRLRSIVVKLEVSLEGDRPKLEKVRRLLEEDGTEPEHVAALLRHIDETNIEGGLYNPSFKVIFADGIVRRATVNPSDPLRYINQSVVLPDGTVEVVIPDRDVSLFVR